MTDELSVFDAMARYTRPLEECPNTKFLVAAYHFAMDQMPEQLRQYGLEEVVLSLPLAARSLGRLYFTDGFTTDEDAYFEVGSNLPPRVVYTTLLIYYQFVHGLTPLEEAANDAKVLTGIGRKTGVLKSERDVRLFHNLTFRAALGHEPRAPYVYFDDPGGSHRILVFHDGIVLHLDQYEARNCLSKDEFHEMREQALARLEERTAALSAATKNATVSELLPAEPMRELASKK